jgi:YebC/PmpR family DNA-binding regulatory protein
MKRGSGATETDNYEEIRYEGYGIGGVAVIVEALSDNRNRTAAEVRAAFTKYAGNLGETGSVNFMFDYLGEILYPANVTDEATMLEAAIEAGASDCELDGDHHRITTSHDSLHEVSAALEAKFGQPNASQFVWQPQNLTPISEEQATTLLKMLDALEDSDDVQRVTTNADISEEVLEKLSA